LKPREEVIFAGLTDAYCSPGPALPSVRDSDAVSFVNQLLAASPRINRIGFRVILRLLDVAPLLCGYRRRFCKLAASERDEFLRGLDKSRWMLLRIGARLLKTIAVMSYWGDRRVLHASGYDPDANVARARALRTREGRP
jgi:hypothetical protein